MNKYLSVLGLACLFFATQARGQSDSLDVFKQIDSMDADKNPAPATSGTSQAADSQKEPTIITAAKESNFDQKERMAVFIGDVHVKNPQFTLTADKLTVYFKKEADNKPAAGAKPSATPKPAASAPAAPAPQGGGIDHIVAEGNVVVVSDRPDSNGGQPVHYVGKAEKLDYNPTTGEAVLSGWPKVQQGINTMVATESSTVISLNRDGHMNSKDGSVKMEVHDPGPDKPSPTPSTPPAIQ